MSPRASDAPRPHVAALGALAVLAAAGVVATYVLWVRTRAGQQLDQDAFDGRAISRDARRRPATSCGRSASGRSSSRSACSPRSRSSGIGARWRSWPQSRSAGAVLTTEVRKPFVYERPALLDSARDFHNSYPSGHTTIADGIAATIVAPRRARRVVAAAAFLYGTGIGLSTVLAGWHRPSDVVGGLLVATAWAARTVAVLTLTDADTFGPERPGRRPALDAESRADASAARRYVLTAIGAVGAGWIATDAVVLSTRASSLDLTHADAAFVWACAAIVGFAAIVFAALLMALRPALPRRTSGHARPVM